MAQHPHDILIVDDEADIRSLVAGILDDEGYSVRTACHGREALQHVSQRKPNLVILDVWLGDSEVNGLKILEILHAQHPEIPVIMMSGHGNIEMAVNAIKNGAYDFIEKPFKSERLLLTVARALDITALKRENNELKRKVRIDAVLEGSNPAIAQLRHTIESVGASSGRVFISGPAGSDKESIARMLHNQSKRHQGPFVVVRCQDIHPSDLEVTLFGSEMTETAISDTYSHIKTSTMATDMQRRRAGLIEQAHTGTLYLSEITNVPLAIQNKLSRLLQEQSLTRLGGNERISIDVRFMAGSSENINQMIKEELFKDHLFYRLSVHHLHIPALCERLVDLPLIVQRLLADAAELYSMPAKIITEEALILMQAYNWPGDIHQLRHVIEWLMLTHQGERYITQEMLPPEVLSGNNFTNAWRDKSSKIIALPLREARELFEREYLVTQVNRFSGNISQTARFIGMERSALHRKLRTLGMHDMREVT